MTPSADGISGLRTSTTLLLSSLVSGKLCSNVSQIAESYSFAHTTLNPAFLKPRSKPPAPENKDTTFIYQCNVINFTGISSAGLLGFLTDTSDTEIFSVCSIVFLSTAE